jgi:hypothetical protein
MSNVPVTATAERRATRRHPFYGDVPVETPHLDALEAERVELAAAEAEEAEREAKDAEKLAAAQSVLTPGAVEQLITAQERVSDAITEYIEAQEQAVYFRTVIESARDTMIALGVEPPVEVPPALYLRATVGGDFLLRQKLERFVALAMARGEA